MNLPSLQLPWTPLYPSQTSGAPSLERALWRGQERRFVVQWHEDRAYFGLLDGEPGLWASLDECEESEVVACFQEAVRNRRYGICFSHYSDLHRHNFGMKLHFIYAPDGTGMLREWSSRDWLAFAPQETRAWALFPDTVLPQRTSGRRPTSLSYGCCRAAIHCVENELLFRRVSAEEIERLRFHSNSNRQEFEQVVRLLWSGGLFRHDHQHRHSCSASAGNDEHVLNGYFYAHCDRAMNPAFMDWLHAYFSPQGFEWRLDDWGKRRFRKVRAREPHLRAWFRPQGVVWRVEFGEEPSFHEQLEARLQLRDWLRHKAPAAQIEAWLGSSS